MTRIATIMTVLLLAACDVGSVLNRQVGADGMAAGSGDGGGSNVAQCVNAQTPDTDDGEGLTPTMTGGCMSATGCHSQSNGLALGAGAPEYSYAGTVYKDAAGTTPYPGATIELTIGTMTVKMISGNNGNFHSVPLLAPPPTTATPVKTSATLCPTLTPMVDSLVPSATAQGGGNCNACHTTGAGAQAPPIYITP